MDSLNSQKAVKSHPSKVVNDQSNKTTVAKVGHNNQSDLKDTNFEYEDNEWDDVGIGSLIIDLDADIEKSSSTNLESNSLVIPTIGSTENINAPQNSSKSGKDKNSDSDSAEKSKRKEGSNMSTTTNSGNKSSKISMDHQATLDKGLKMKIKRTKTGTKTSDSKHEIVKSDHNNGIVSSDDSFTGNSSKKLPNAINIPSSPSSSNKRGNNSHKKEKSKEKSGSKEKLDIPMNQSENHPCGCIIEKVGNLPSTPCNSTKCTKLKETAPPPPPTSQSNRTGSSNHSSSSSSSGSSSTSNATAPGKLEKNSHVNSTKHPKDLITFTEFSKSLSKVSNSIIHSKNEDAKVSSPPMKKTKCDASPKDMVDVCIGTSIGTITEPDCLGPCEPGTSVTLEGIVWHETEGGVLAVNVTWRGKTYVGTLIDCTKHDWAPPRFCDSPTEELDSRLPKGGRAKRGRNSVTSNDVLETRSSVHSKLRNGGSKGRASRNSSSTNVNISTSTAITNTPSTSPTTFSVPRPEKRRKSKDESPPFNGNPTPTTTVNNAPNNPAAAVAQASASKKPKSVASPCAISPVLLECPEQDCSKKYKHANGLKYHQSHAHGINADDDSLTAPESPQRSQSPDIVKTEDKIDEDSNMPQINFESVKPSIEAISDTAVDRFPIIQKSSSTDPTFDSRPENPTKQDSTNTNTPSKFTNISDIEQTSNDSNDVQNSSFYKASNLSKKKSDHKEKMEDSSSDAIGVGGSANKPENNPARSPAYSDISDDSNIATDNGLADKHNANSDVKKVTEPGPTNLMLAPYNSMYGQFYQGSSFFTPPDSQSTKAINPSPQQPPLIKDPSPLDLINKIQPIKAEPIVPSASNPNVGKMPHFQHYPYNFIQSNYPYMENNYGNMPTDEKPQGIQIKEELRKENASPDNIKTKPIKTEPKDIKTESGPPANLQLPQQHMSPYPGNSHMYPSSRHAPSISREEDLQKYFIYPEQRRPPHGGTPTNLSKDERTSQSPTTPQSSSFNKPSKSSSSSSSTPSSSSKHSSSSSKDTKGEEKDVKVKQEGQKPTMETQGPPPPPTSQQYYLPYMTPGSSPFGFPDPMYRNMPFPPSPYNPSYHLQMARFTSPEDLSRNPNTKALDLLQQHASQYYNNHKIHELSERHSQLKSPTSNPKIPISSSPTLAGQSTTTPNANITPSNLPGSNSSPQSLNLKTNEKPERPDLKDPTPGSNGSRPLSPPTQRHVHTHLHTHQLAGIGYHPYPYVNPAVLASQQAVINPFTNPPANKQ